MHVYTSLLAFVCTYARIPHTHSSLRFTFEDEEGDTCLTVDFCVHTLTLARSRPEDP